MKFSKGRNKSSSISIIDLEESLKIIVYYFGENWLNEDKGHPLQTLWKRRDALATNELYTLGSSIISIQDVDANWLKTTIKKIKIGDINNIIGFVFEIIASAMIKNGSNQNLILPPGSNPGYDLISEFKDNSILNISCKNHGLSDRNKLFNKTAKNFESFFVELCKKHGKNRIQCHIVNITSNYAEDYDWSNLKKGLEHPISIFKGDELHFVIAKTWFVALLPIEDSRKISDVDITYIFSIFSPFHEYEKSNLYLKFEDACDNLDKHGVKQSEDKVNIIFIHLPANASLNACEKWAKDYLNDHAHDKFIAGIFFIQNMVVTDIKKSESFIAIVMKAVTNKHYSLWFSKNPKQRLIKFEVVVGHILDESPQYKHYLDDKEVDNGDIDFDNSYIYQSGKIFVEFEKDKEVKLGSLGYGVKNYLVIYGEKGKILIEPILPPDDKLILI